jgi:Na+/melibiose symporter-like transporter
MAITPQTLRFLAYAVLALVPLITAAAVIWGPAGIPIERAAKYRLRDLVSIVRGNKPLWIFLAGFLLAGVAEGMFGALSFLYFTGYLGLANEFIIMFVLLYAVGLLFMPVVPRIMRRFGKHHAWGVSMMAGLCIFALMLLLPQGRAAFVPLLLMMIPIGCTNALNSIAAPSLLGDIIDYDTLKTGKQRAATYSALYALVVKLNTAVGGAVAFLIIGLVHYQPKLGAANSPEAILGLKIAFVLAPAIIYGCSFMFVWFFPIDRRRQDIIRRRLEARDRRALAAEGTAMRTHESGTTPHTRLLEQAQ